MAINVGTTYVIHPSITDVPFTNIEFVKGGWQTVATTTARDAIHPDRISEGQIIYVIEDTKTYSATKTENAFGEVTITWTEFFFNTSVDVGVLTSDTALSINPGTNTIGFVGTSSWAVSASYIGTASNAVSSSFSIIADSSNTINITNEASSNNFPLIFANSATGNSLIKSDNTIVYNPSTKTLSGAVTASFISGNFTTISSDSASIKELYTNHSDGTLFHVSTSIATALNTALSQGTGESAPFNGNRFITNQLLGDLLGNNIGTTGTLTDFVEQVFFPNTLPIIDSNQLFTVDEFTAVNTVIGNVVAEDPDGGSVTFNTQNIYTAGNFGINESNGNIFVKTKTSDSTNTNNFNGTPVQFFPIIVTDSKGGKTLTTVFIQVISNEAPIFRQSSVAGSPYIGLQAYSLSENDTNFAGGPKFFYFSDAEGDIITIETGSGDEGANSTEFKRDFNLHVSGTFVKLEVNPNEQLDESSFPTYNLALTASDSHFQSSEDPNSITHLPIRISLNANVFPTIGDQILTGVTESITTVGTSVGTLSASDPESDSITVHSFTLKEAFLGTFDAQGNFTATSGDIKSTLDGTSYDSPSQDPFESVNGSLDITLKSGQLLNARVANMYIYTVEVKQSGQTSTFDSADIQISIGRVRDLTLTPNFNNAYIIETATVGDRVVNWSGGKNNLGSYEGVFPDNSNNTQINISDPDNGNSSYSTAIGSITSTGTKIGFTDGTTSKNFTNDSIGFKNVSSNILGSIYNSDNTLTCILTIRRSEFPPSITSFTFDVNISNNNGPLISLDKISPQFTVNHNTSLAVPNNNLAKLTLNDAEGDTIDHSSLNFTGTNLQVVRTQTEVITPINLTTSTITTTTNSNTTGTVSNTSTTGFTVNMDANKSAQVEVFCSSFQQGLTYNVTARVRRTSGPAGDSFRAKIITNTPFSTATILGNTTVILGVAYNMNVSFTYNQTDSTPVLEFTFSNSFISQEYVIDRLSVTTPSIGTSTFIDGDDYNLRPSTNLAADTYPFTFEIDDQHGNTGEISDSITILGASNGTFTTNGSFYIIESATTGDNIVINSNGYQGNQASITYSNDSLPLQAFTFTTSPSTILTLTNDGNDTVLLSLASNVRGNYSHPLTINETITVTSGNGFQESFDITINITENLPPFIISIVDENRSPLIEAGTGTNGENISLYTIGSPDDGPNSVNATVTNGNSYFEMGALSDNVSNVTTHLRQRTGISIPANSTINITVELNDGYNTVSLNRSFSIGAPPPPSSNIHIYSYNKTNLETLAGLNNQSVENYVENYLKGSVGVNNGLGIQSGSVIGNFASTGTDNGSSIGDASFSPSYNNAGTGFSLNGTVSKITTLSNKSNLAGVTGIASAGAISPSSTGHLLILFPDSSGLSNKPTSMLDGPSPALSNQGGRKYLYSLGGLSGFVASGVFYFNINEGTAEGHSRWGIIFTEGVTSATATYYLQDDTDSVPT